MARDKTLSPYLPEGSGTAIPRWFSALFCFFFCLSAAICEAAPAQSAKPFRVFTKREGNVTRFFVENFEAAEITATFEMDLENLTGSTNFPYAHWTSRYTTHYTLGSSVAAHDRGQIYMLPFEPGETFRVTQGYNGTYSHTGPDQYAIDFRMPVGTPVHAARGGTVVKVKTDSSVGGGDRKYQNQANYILIRHNDATLANYAHLKKDGSVVKVGDFIEAGDLIGYSGNTGFSSGPHLHFSVFKTRNGSQRQTLPVKFRTSDAMSLTLAEGKNYTCAHHTVARVKPPRPTSPVIADTKSDAAGRP